MMKPKTGSLILISLAVAALVALIVVSCARCPKPKALGHLSTEKVQSIVRPSHFDAVTAIEHMIFTEACPAIFWRYAKSTCTASKIDYDIVFSKRGERSWFIQRFPDFELANSRGKTSSIIRAWLEGEIYFKHCESVNALYGSGSCNPARIDYTIRYIRNKGQTRTIVELFVPVFVSGEIPPNALRGVGLSL